MRNIYDLIRDLEEEAYKRERFVPSDPLIALLRQAAAALLEQKIELAEYSKIILEQSKTK